MPLVEITDKRGKKYKIQFDSTPTDADIDGVVASLNRSSDAFSGAKASAKTTARGVGATSQDPFSKALRSQQPKPKAKPKADPNPLATAIKRQLAQGAKSRKALEEERYARDVAMRGGQLDSQGRAYFGPQVEDGTDVVSPDMLFGPRRARESGFKKIATGVQGVYTGLGGMVDQVQGGGLAAAAKAAGLTPEQAAGNKAFLGQALTALLTAGEGALPNALDNGLQILGGTSAALDPNAGEGEYANAAMLFGLPLGMKAGGRALAKAGGTMKKIARIAKTRETGWEGYGSDLMGPHPLVPGKFDPVAPVANEASGAMFRQPKPRPQMPPQEPAPGIFAQPKPKPTTRPNGSIFEELFGTPEPATPTGLPANPRPQNARPLPLPGQKDAPRVARERMAGQKPKVDAKVSTSDEMSKELSNLYRTRQNLALKVVEINPTHGLEKVPNGDGQKREYAFKKNASPEDIQALRDIDNEIEILSDRKRKASADESYARTKAAESEYGLKEWTEATVTDLDGKKVKGQLSTFVLNLDGQVQGIRFTPHSNLPQIDIPVKHFDRISRTKAPAKPTATQTPKPAPKPRAETPATTAPAAKAGQWQSADGTSNSVMRDVTPEGMGPAKASEKVVEERMRGESVEDAINRKIGYQVDNGIVKIESVGDSWVVSVKQTGGGVKKYSSFKKQQAVNEAYSELYSNTQLVAPKALPANPRPQTAKPVAGGAAPRMARERGAVDAKGEKHYIFIERNGKRVPIAGPFVDAAEASRAMRDAQDWAKSQDRWAHFDTYSQAKTSNTQTQAAIESHLSKRGWKGDVPTQAELDAREARIEASRPKNPEREPQAEPAFTKTPKTETVSTDALRAGDEIVLPDGRVTKVKQVLDNDIVLHDSGSFSGRKSHERVTPAPKPSAPKSAPDAPDAPVAKPAAPSAKVEPTGNAKEPWELPLDDHVWGKQYKAGGATTERALQNKVNYWQKLLNQGADVSDALRDAQSKLARLKEHKPSVQKALADGKPVPPEVLADYPDLAPTKPTPEPPVKAGATGGEVFTRAEVLVSKPTTRQRKRTNGTDGEVRVTVEAPNRVTNDDVWDKITHHDRLKATVEARIDFATGAKPKQSSPVWSIYDRDRQYIDGGFTYAEAIEKAKAYVHSAVADAPAPKSAQAKADFDAALTDVKTHKPKGNVGSGLGGFDAEYARKVGVLVQKAAVYGYRTVEELIAGAVKHFGRPLTKSEETLYRQKWAEQYGSSAAEKPKPTPASVFAKPQEQPKPITKADEPFVPVKEATGLARQFDDAERAALGLPVTSKKAHTVSELADMGQTLAERGNIQVRIQKAIEGSKGLTPKEVAAAAHYKREVFNEYNDLAAKMQKATGADAHEIAQRMREIEGEMANISEAAQNTRTQWHELGMSLQVAYQPDYSLATLVARAKEAGAGAELTPAMRSKVEAYAKRISELEAQLAGVKPKVEAEVMKAAGNMKAEQAVKSRNSALNWLRKVGIIAGEAKPTGGVKGKQAGAILIPRDQMDATARAIRQLARSYISDGSANSLDTVLANLRRDVPGIDDAQSLMMLSSEYRNTILEADVAKLEIDASMRRLRSEADRKTWDTAKKIRAGAWDILNGAQRTFQAGMDISAPFLQGRKVLTNLNASGWVRGWVPMMKALAKGEKEALKVAADIKRRPMYARARKAGLELTDGNGAFVGREETFHSHIVDKLKKVPVLKVYAHALENSEAAYNAFLNSVRMDTFEKLAAKAGDDPDYLRDVARMVNIATGRGDGKFAKMLGNEVAGAVFYAPRFAYSNIQDLGTIGGAVGSRSTLGRNTALKHAARGVAVNAAAIGLASLFGDVELDPRATDFGKVTFPDGTQLDILGKTSDPIKLAVQTFYGKTSRKGNYTEPGSFQDQMPTSWVEGKLSPGARLLLGPLREGTYYNARTGEREPVTLLKALKEQLAPLGWRDVGENALGDDATPLSRVLSPLSLAGGNVGRKMKPGEKRKAPPPFSIVPPGLQKVSTGSAK